MYLSTTQIESVMLARYEVQLRAQVETVLPPFLGSALRGAWGHALKAVACSMPHGDCGRCLLVERCLYPRLFETAARSGNGARSNGAASNGVNSSQAAASRSVTSGIPSNGRTDSRDRASKQTPNGQGSLLKHRQDAPRPFIFIPPLPGNENGFLRARDDLLRWRVRVKAGEPIVFGLSLIGDAINDLPYVIYAISLMAQHGFGAERASFALERVAALDAQDTRTIVYTAEANRIAGHPSCLTTLGALTQARLETLAIADCQLPIAASATATAKSIAATAPGAKATLKAGSPIPNSQSAIRDEVTLRFLTPARMRLKGRVIENPSFAQLISSLSLRLSMLAETFAGAPLTYDYKAIIERAHEVTIRGSTLRLMALDRYSNRRGGKLELDGFMGEITFAGPAIQDLLPLLVAGEFLHVGSGTAFGLGRYQIVTAGR